MTSNSNNSRDEMMYALVNEFVRLMDPSETAFECRESYIAGFKAADSHPPEYVRELVHALDDMATSVPIGNPSDETMRMINSFRMVAREALAKFYEATANRDSKDGAK